MKMTQRVVSAELLSVALLVGASALLAGCGSSSTSASGPSGPTCASLGIKDAVVTDIDGTLTTSDGEFLQQILNSSYDPKERTGGAKLMQDYSQRGYFIFYLTARSTTTKLNPTGESALDATSAWLKKHGYPLGSDRSKIQLANQLLTGDSAHPYKAAALQAMQSAGYKFDYAYGNATTDIEAYSDAGIAKNETFIIGPLTGSSGTAAVQGQDWTQHDATQMPQVKKLCSF